jgi:hypothetical protein
MKRALLVGCSILALVVFPALGASANDLGAEPDTSLLLTQIFAPAEVSAPAESLPVEEVLFVSEDAAELAVRICCEGNFRVCDVNCGGSVCSYSCSRVGNGCSSSCRCC